MNNYIIPIIVLFILTYGLYKKINIYESFIEGIKDGLKMILDIAPTIIVMMFAINIFLNSNVIYNLKIFDYIAKIFNFPKEIIPMILLRPISGNATLGILNELLYNYGPDSIIGRIASTIQGCTDTTIYIMALYFGSIKVTKTRYALYVCLLADLIGIVSSIIIVKIVFNY